MGKAFALAVVGGVVVVGCGTSAPKPNPAVDDAMKYLPADSEVVAGFDIAQVRSGPLAQTVKDAIATDEKYVEAVSTCHIDPLSLIDRVLVGGSKTPADHGVVVVRGHGMGKLLDCMATLNHAEQIDGVVLFSGEDDTAAMAADDATLIAVFGDDITADDVRRVAKAKGGLMAVGAFTSLYRTVDTNRAAWFALRGSFLDGNDIDPAPRSLTLSIDIASKVALDARIRFKSSSDASSAMSRYSPEIKTKFSAGTATIKQDDADVVLTLSLTAAATRDLLASLRGSDSW